MPSLTNHQPIFKKINLLRGNFTRYLLRGGFFPPIKHKTNRKAQRNFLRIMHDTNWLTLVRIECVTLEAGNATEISFLSLHPCLVTKSIYQCWLKVRTSAPDEILTFLTFHFIPNWKKIKYFSCFL